MFLMRQKETVELEKHTISIAYIKIRHSKEENDWKALGILEGNERKTAETEAHDKKKSLQNTLASPS